MLATWTIALPFLEHFEAEFRAILLGFLISHRLNVHKIHIMIDALVLVNIYRSD